MPYFCRMIQYILEGLGWGLVLAVSLGPIFVLLTQTAMDKGYKAGLGVGAGVWVSDFIYIYFCYRFVVTLESYANDPNIKFWVGLIGGSLLVIFGIFLIINKKTLNHETVPLTAKNYLENFSKGFAINTFNPFTPVFWLTIVSTYVIGKGTNTTETMVIFITIMCVIIVSDTVKVLLAEYIRDRLRPIHLHYVAVTSGSFLILFGLIMCYNYVL